jgi:hypothetical protein
MPPQPLKKYRGLITVGPEVLETRPALALRIAKIAAISSHLQMQLGLLLAALLRTEAATGVAMYLSLSGTRPQEAILTGAATHRLNKTDLDDFKHLMNKVVRPALTSRNNVVHRMWATSDEYADTLIAIDPNEMAAELAEHPIPPPVKRTDAMYLGSGKHPPTLMKWKKKDLIEVEKRLEKALSQACKFTALVLRKFPSR